MVSEHQDASSLQSLFHAFKGWWKVLTKWWLILFFNFPDSNLSSLAVLIMPASQFLLSYVFRSRTISRESVTHNIHDVKPYKEEFNIV